MATTMGGCKLFVFEELVVAQGDVKDVGKKVESLFIEFDQAAYEVYLSDPGSPKATRDYHKILARSRAHTCAPIAPVASLQPTNMKIQARVGGASAIDDDANRPRHHIFFPPREPQVLGASLPLKRNHNAKRRQEVAANFEHHLSLSYVPGKEGSACNSSLEREPLQVRASAPHPHILKYMYMETLPSFCCSSLGANTTYYFL